MDEYLLMRDEAAEMGTYLHNQIESYLKKTEFDSASKEFAMFLDFYNKEIKRAIETFTALLEPILIIFLGGAIAILAISVIEPIYGSLGTI